MQRPQDTIGSGRWLGLLGVSALAMLAGCDWIGGSTPIGPPPRPGVERDIAPVSAIPPAPGNRQYDAPVTAGEETRNSTPTIGSIVAGKGGQKAQKEALDKEQADHDRKDREARDERDAADKEAKRKEKEQGGTPGAAPASSPVGAPPAGSGSITSEPPVSAPVPPSAPVTAAPMAPPSAAPDPATPGAPAVAPQPLPVPTAPTPPADPNKVFAPQPGWTPPGTNVGSVMTLAPLTVAFATSAPGVDDACGELVAAPATGNIAKAQSGEVPYSALKSPPFGGPLQVAVIQFGHASSGLDETDYAVLARVAEIQRDNGGTVRIVAHAAEDVVATSRAGIERGNFDVSRRRALVVGQQLRRLGVPADQIVAEAASNDEPIYQTSTARGLAANRRADVFIDF